MGELEVILNYMKSHNDVSREYYKSVINQITKYLGKTGKEFSYMSTHIDDLTKKIESADVNVHVTKTEKL